MTEESKREQAIQARAQSFDREMLRMGVLLCLLLAGILLAAVVARAETSSEAVELTAKVKSLEPLVRNEHPDKQMRAEIVGDRDGNYRLCGFRDGDVSGVITKSAHNAAPGSTVTLLVTVKVQNGYASCERRDGHLFAAVKSIQ